MANEANIADHLRTIGSVYILRAGNSAFVKIGWARDVARRVSELQTANSAKLRVLVTVPGDKGLEGRLHHRFREERHRREWFRLSDPIREFIRQNGGPVLIQKRWLGPCGPDDVRAAMEAAFPERLAGEG